jgi:hypothetical protein
VNNSLVAISMAGMGLGRYLLDDDPARWAAGFVRTRAAGRDVPAYGSPEWQAADWQVQVASAVRAAESWRREGLFLEQRVADELAAYRYWQDVADAERFAEVAASVRRMASTPTHAQLAERRVA